MSATGPTSSTGIACAGGLRLHNLVLPALFAAAAVAVLTTGFVTSAPNRLVSGRPVGLFAALEGIGAGSIAPGQTRLCDHLHGSTA